ncbi:hypothetical protein BOX15_Mlig011876g2 [Macrostomum lignano]|uniref:Cupin-like domain-containing protein n=1 Tax=Macrostomum lignano TaxID=282301 RepID=A0A267G6R2_9PLAT|nr:hypothetical protein BOX15_Mlig011876g2 [Macrostomum lignano]
MTDPKFLLEADKLLGQQSKPEAREALLADLIAELKDRAGSRRRSVPGLNRWSLLVCLTVLVHAYSVSRGYVITPGQWLASWKQKPCAYKAWMFLLETARHPSNCEATCGGLSHNGHVDIEYYHNLTKERFEKVYVRPARPVIVRNSTLDWPAMASFNLSFFRDLYDKYPKSYAPHHYRNKLLPFRLPMKYKKLQQAFHMSEEDQAKPWYFGWSNVDLNVHFELQNYYKVPHFLPEDTEHGQMEWFFMGTSQEAAYLHVDHTIKPAWQAQIRGRKVWELHPPAECWFQCPPVRAHLQDGDLFVIDPSVWYHGTFIYPGELSITFGMEFV